MSKQKIPVTAAVRLLRKQKVVFTLHLYPYVEKGGTAEAARCLNVTEHSVIKTLIMEDDRQCPLIVLMHGDRQVSTKELARIVGVKSVTPCDPVVANKHTGYQVGGTSSFGTRRKMPVYMESSILDLPLIYLNGGRRGFMIAMKPEEVRRILQPTLVQVAIAVS